MSRVVLGGSGLEVEQAGSGEPLLLLHGFSGTMASWSAQLPSLSAAHRTIAVDLLGHGRSDAPAEPDCYDVERQAQQLVSLLGRLGAVPAAVLGYSMGARIALMMATEFPDSIRMLLLESPSAGIADDAERGRRRQRDARLADRIEHDGIAAFVDGWEAQPLFASQAALPDAARSRLRHERLAQRPAGLAASLRGGGQGSMAPLHARLATLRCPSLIIAGALDPVGLRRARSVADGIPGARFDVIAGAGHAPHLERPEAFSRSMASFLETTSEKQPH